MPQVLSVLGGHGRVRARVESLMLLLTSTAMPHAIGPRTGAAPPALVVATIGAIGVLKASPHLKMDFAKAK